MAHEKNNEYAGILKIRLTKALPDWAKQSISALKQIPAITLVTQDDLLESETVDVVLHYGEYSASISQQFGYGRLGLWFFRFNNSDIDPVTAARIAASQHLPLEASLWARFPDGRCECMYQSFGFLEPFAIKRSVSRTLAKAAYFPGRVLLSYRREGTLKTYPANGNKVPFSLLAGYLGGVSAIIRKIVKKLFWKEQWFVVAGTGKSLLPDPATGKKWVLEPPSDRFWADPFPVICDGRKWILIEELPFSTMQGHLAAIELFEDGSHGDAQTIMAHARHLSYPFVFEWNSELYMVPESGSANNVVLWKCLQFPNKWTEVATLLADVRAADTTLVHNADGWWMFVAIAGQNACIHDELHLYFAETPLGPWQEHPGNPIKSDARNARPAGNLFELEGVLYRPAQDCGSEYGKATVINRIDRLDTWNFSETPVARLDPGWRSDCLRTHTLSRFDNLWAIDGYRLLPRWPSLFLYKMIRWQTTEKLKTAVVVQKTTEKGGIDIDGKQCQNNPT